MRATLTLLLPLTFLLLVLAPAKARDDCSSHIVGCKDKPEPPCPCDRAECSFDSRVAFAQLGCPKDATSCTWTGQCMNQGCNFTYCVYR
uniref:Uncharacterized protein n=2 Tax=Aegilops tauschii TaxID=37682 RepID=A0A453SLD9_AEGTS